MSKEIEGIIKYVQFLSPWNDIEAFSTLINQLNQLREPLYKLGLVGVDSEGIGYGNISARVSDSAFIITSSQTGHFLTLQSEDYSYVYKTDISKQKLWSRGVKKASSESLTHAALYKLSPNIQYIIHIHCNALWNSLLNHSGTKKTGKDVEYGTKMMAEEMNRLFRQPNDKFVLLGHTDGIIYFGSDPSDLINTISNDYHSLVTSCINSTSDVTSGG
jgi:hypothetical protein